MLWFGTNSIEGGARDFTLLASASFNNPLRYEVSLDLALNLECPVLASNCGYRASKVIERGFVPATHFKRRISQLWN